MEKQTSRRTTYMLPLRGEVSYFGGDKDLLPGELLQCPPKQLHGQHISQSVASLCQQVKPSETPHYPHTCALPGFEA